MTEHHPFGMPRRPGGIDDGGEGVIRHLLHQEFSRGIRQPLINMHHPDRAASCCNGLQCNHCVQLRQRLFDGVELLPLLVTLDQQQTDSGILEQPGDIAGAIIGVDGHGHQSQSQCGLVKQHPLAAVAQHHGNAVAFLQAALLHGALPASCISHRLRPAVVDPLLCDGIELHKGCLIRRDCSALAE